MTLDRQKKMEEAGGLDKSFRQSRGATTEQRDDSRSEDQGLIGQGL